jgi:hypothetical protein
VNFHELDGLDFLNVPFVAGAAVKGTKIRQPTKPRRSAKELHRPRTAMASRSFGQGFVGVVHNTISGVSAGCGAQALRLHGQQLNFWQDFA